MSNKTVNLALVSPINSAYSETFIKAQRELLPFNVVYYHGGNFPKFVEGKAIRLKRGLLRRSFDKVFSRFSDRKLKEKALSQSFREHNIQVVLAQYGPTGEAVSKVCNAMELPLVTHFHGYDSGMYDVLEKLENYKQTFAISSAVIAVSKAMYNQLHKLGCPEDKLHQITYGPNDLFNKVSPKYSENQFIGIGRFTDKKAPYYTILAFSKVLKEHPTAHLTIAGNGELYFTCKNLVDYLGISDNVSLPGAITPEEYAEYLEKCTAFVQHSIVTDKGDTEGTPLAVLEASAAGLPVISTKHAGIPDVITEETGVLVNEHDIDGMANGMIEFLNNRGLAKKMGMAGKNRIRDKFSMTLYIQKLANTINQVIGE